MNKCDNSLKKFAIPNNKDANAKERFKRKLYNSLRVDHFKLSLPNVRSYQQGNPQNAFTELCNTLCVNNEHNIFGQPSPYYNKVPFRNNIWHFTSPDLSLTKFTRNGITTVKAPLNLNMNMTRYYAHLPIKRSQAFSIPEVVRNIDIFKSMIKQHRVESKLRGFTLDDSDNILVGERYLGTTTHLSCLRTYLESTLSLFENVFNQIPCGDDGNCINDILTNPNNVTFEQLNRFRVFRDSGELNHVNRSGFLLKDVEFYVDFKCSDAVEKVKQLGKVILRIGREVRLDEYVNHRAHYSMKNEGHCYSYRAKLNNEKDIKIYAKTSTRIRIEIILKGSLRNHCKNVHCESAVDNMMGLFSKGCELAVNDIASFLYKVSEHKPFKKYEHQIGPRSFTKFMSSIYRAADGNENIMQKIICELLDYNALHRGDDANYNRALNALHSEGIIKRMGIENRVTKPVYILSDTYEGITQKLVKKPKKLRLRKGSEELISKLDY